MTYWGLDCALLGVGSETMEATTSCSGERAGTASRCHSASQKKWGRGDIRFGAGPLILRG